MNGNMNMKDYLKTALEAAQNAGKIIMERYDSTIDVRIKDDLSPVTEIDILAEKAIVNTIAGVFPSHCFLGEELTKSVNESEYLWVIDPIDGTKNYIRNIPLFATQIALLHKGQTILGVSSAPALGETLYASKGKGSHKDGAYIRVSGTKSLDEAYISFGNIVHFEKRGFLQGLTTLANMARGVRGFGDAWSYHLLASGKIDVMVDAKTSIWDIAAIKTIVEEAGGRVTDFQGNAVTMETQNIIATNGLLHEAVLRCFRI